jgi:hypothetical protein
LNEKPVMCCEWMTNRAGEASDSGNAHSAHEALKNNAWNRINWRNHETISVQRTRQRSIFQHIHVMQVFLLFIKALIRDNFNYICRYTKNTFLPFELHMYIRAHMYDRSYKNENHYIVEKQPFAMRCKLHTRRKSMTIGSAMPCAAPPKTDTWICPICIYVFTTYRMNGYCYVGHWISGVFGLL